MNSTVQVSWLMSLTYIESSKSATRYLVKLRTLTLLRAVPTMSKSWHKGYSEESHISMFFTPSIYQAYCIDTYLPGRQRIVLNGSPNVTGIARDPSQPSILLQIKEKIGLDIT